MWLLRQIQHRREAHTDTQVHSLTHSLISTQYVTQNTFHRVRISVFFGLCITQRHVYSRCIVFIGQWQHLVFWNVSLSALYSVCNEEIHFLSEEGFFLLLVSFCIKTASLKLVWILLLKVLLKVSKDRTAVLVLVYILCHWCSSPSCYVSSCLAFQWKREW